VVAEFMGGELSMHPVIFTIVGIIILLVIAVAIMLIPEFVRYQKIRHM
jgi:membrane protein YdbS with pleckstrin-like domain